MSMETVSKKRNRIYPRKFDHDEARRLHIMEDWGWQKLAEHFGVSRNAVRRVCDPVFRKDFEERTRAFGMSGTCRACGGPRARYKKSDSTHLCRQCEAEGRRTRFRFDELGQLAAIRCGTCGRWKQPELFAGDKNSSLGKHGQCRSCSTKARGNYRDRHKVPCAFCGTLCLPPSEKGARSFHLPRCRSCFIAWQSEYMKTEEFRAKIRKGIAKVRPPTPKPLPNLNLCPKGHRRAPGRKTCDRCMAESEGPD